MSVAAMTMDDQRPLMNNFDPMKKQYDHISNASGAAATVGGAVVAGPASGPASPTPSASEEQQQQQQQHHHHHHHHSGHHHHHQSHHQQQPTTSTQSQQQQQQPQLQHDAASAVAVAEQRQRLLEGEIEILKLEQTRLAQQCTEAQRREKILMRRLANKEQEFQDYVSQIAEYKAAQAPGPAALRSALLDPAVNLLFEKLKKELKATKAKLEETQNELSAWKFTPDSNTGKRLMAKCRLLYQENEELGKMTSNGRLAKLETELAMQKSFSEEVKKSQSELDDFLQELDEDVEGMQSTILFLQQELKTTRDRIQVLEKENSQLKNGDVSNENTIDSVDTQQQIQHMALNGNTDNSNNNAEMIGLVHNANNPTAIIATTLNAISVSASKEFKQSKEVECQDEPNGLRSTCNINVALPITTPTDLLNGLEEQAPKIGFAQDDDGGNKNNNNNNNNNNSNSSNNSIGSKLPRTTVVARKRNYDESEAGVDENCEALSTSAAAIIAVPRTLPPKKSKLRVTPARRASMQSLEIGMAENENAMALAVGVPVVSTANNNNMQLDMLAPPNAQMFAVGGMSVDEVGGGMTSVPEEETNNSSSGSASVSNNSNSSSSNASLTVAPQRIMTRRRSLRNPSNGDSVV